MRYSEIKILTEAAKVGREYQHLEDLVFVDGAAGALEAAKILNNMGSNASDVAIKWDGNPTVYFGREPDGTFVLVGKNGWGRNMSTKPEDLSNFIKSSGQGEEWREKFGNDMAQVFSIMKSSFPTGFEGYVYGDLLYHPGKTFAKSKNGIQFTPNKVTYTVDPSSEIGNRIGNSKIGVVVHTKYSAFGEKSGTPIEDVADLNSKDIVVLGQTYVTHQPSVDTSETDSIVKFTRINGRTIDNFLAPQAGLGDLKNIIYTFVNQMVKSKQLNNLNSTGFFNWLKTSKVSQPKQVKIYELHKSSSSSLDIIFKLVNRIMVVKNHIIDQLDQAPADIKATTGDETGGEGYVAQNSKVKLVPRHRWTPN
jgi:hypothetical protein|tara:strand:+ start:1033 stop:2124 length:1092 start_codon:yes stop_codon:yes gene_type:complete